MLGRAVGLLLVMTGISGGIDTCVAEPTDHFADRESRYTLTPSDELELSFAFTPELNQIVTVQPDGFVSLRGGSDVKVGGLTLSAAKPQITKVYSTILHDPVISLSLKDFVKPAVVVSGEVQKPGRYDVRGGTAMTDALAIAGGTTPDAKMSTILLIRRISADTAEVRKFNIRDMQKSGRLEEDRYLQPGDSIYVSQSAMGKVDRFMKVTHLGLYIPLPAIP